MIGIASDHGGFELKQKLIKELKEFDIKDYGTDSILSVDYPLFAFKLGEAVAKKEVNFGIAICTTGIGISIACNKVKGVRCAKVSDIKEAEMSRLHNDANIIALNSKIENPIEVVKTFLTTDFSNEERHIRRINEIKKYEETNEY